MFRTGSSSEGTPTAIFPYDGRQIKEFFEELKRDFAPDVIFTHQRHDLHQDHRFTCEVTWNTFRDHLILEYEIPKYDGDMGAPNLFVPLDENLCRARSRTCSSTSTRRRSSRGSKRTSSRGSSGCAEWSASRRRRYAEAFYCRKAVLA